MEFASLSSSGRWVVVTAKHFMPAALAARTPFGLSSMTMQSVGSHSRATAAFKYPSGFGLARVVS